MLCFELYVYCYHYYSLRAASPLRLFLISYEREKIRRCCLSEALRNGVRIVEGCYTCRQPYSAAKRPPPVAEGSAEKDLVATLESVMNFYDEQERCSSFSTRSRERSEGALAIGITDDRIRMLRSRREVCTYAEARLVLDAANDAFHFSAEKKLQELQKCYQGVTQLFSSSDKTTPRDCQLKVSDFIENFFRADNDVAEAAYCAKVHMLFWRCRRYTSTGMAEAYCRFHHGSEQSSKGWVAEVLVFNCLKKAETIYREHQNKPKEALYGNNPVLLSGFRVTDEKTAAEYKFIFSEGTLTKGLMHNTPAADYVFVKFSVVENMFIDLGYHDISKGRPRIISLTCNGNVRRFTQNYELLLLDSKMESGKGDAKKVDVVNKWCGPIFFVRTRLLSEYSKEKKVHLTLGMSSVVTVDNRSRSLVEKASENLCIEAIKVNGGEEHTDVLSDTYPFYDIKAATDDLEQKIKNNFFYYRKGKRTGRTMT
eukprot:gene2593-1612_t